MGTGATSIEKKAPGAIGKAPQCAHDPPYPISLETRYGYALASKVCTCKKGKVSVFLSLIVRVKLKVL